MRARAVVEDLCAIGADVQVISIGEGDARCIDVQSQAVRVRGIGSGRLQWSSRLPVLLRELDRWADLLVIESAQFLPHIIVSSIKAPLVWDAIGSETLIYRRMPPTLPNLARQAVWLMLESWAARKADVLVAISATDAEWWRQLFPVCSSRLAVVDHRLVDNFPMPPDGSHYDLTATSGPPCLVFVGDIRAKHNRAAADWLLAEFAPALQQPARLVLVGPGTEQLRSHPHAGVVEVLCMGTMPEIHGLLHSAVACLAPLPYGAGVKTKVLDYVAAGARVIGTPIAFEGIEGCPGLTTASLADFCRAVEGLLEQPETVDEAAHRRAAQAAWLEAHHSSSRSKDQWRNVLRLVGLSVP